MKRTLIVSAGGMMLAFSAMAATKTSKKVTKHTTTSSTPATTTTTTTAPETNPHAAPRSAPIKDAFSNQGMGYGTAGCGLGGMVFGNKPGFIQIFAATVNNIISPQTFAITSGTSGCGHKATSSAALFIENNRVALERESARGTGETIAGLSKILGCSSSEKLGHAMQQNYGQIFGQQNASGEEIESTLESQGVCGPQA